MFSLFSAHPRTRPAAIVVGLLVFSAILPARAQTAQGKWDASVEESGTRYLNYTVTTTLLGKPIPIGVSFYCNPTRSKDNNGALGFDLYIRKTAPLAPFHFDDFDGPDAKVTGKLLAVTITRSGAAPLTFAMAPNGWTPSEGYFGFGVADVSHVASEEKTILQALGTAGAESIRIVITDPRDAKLKLDITVPVAGKQGEFQALLKGVK